MKLYTRTGDKGQTGLFGGDRVSKSHPRLKAYGTLDELNSFVGLLRLHTSPATGVEEELKQIQHDLFVLGAVLATPADKLGMLGKKMTTPTWSLEAMEASIDRLTAMAPAMRNFVLPGGTQASAHAHIARTVCRRAEREVVELQAEEPEEPVEPMDPIVLSYLNRLSDWLFALARAENAAHGVSDIEWVPQG